MNQAQRRWELQQCELWQRLCDFSLDQPNAELTFTQRAARENGWTLRYTERTIAEYKHFLFLSRNAGHVVCPSDAVDQIWHMHLTYTRSYWGELCGEVLQGPLHHGPTQGGSDEHVKYFDLYNRTLESYERWFREAPPADIWPAAERRFGEDLQFMRVNTRRAWVVPKPRWTPAAVGFAGAAIVLPLAQLAINPLDWRGPPFLALFFGLLIVVSLLSLIARWWVVRNDLGDTLEGNAKEKIGPIETAWLVGGNTQAVMCATVGLAEQNAIQPVLDKLIAAENIDKVVTNDHVATRILDTVRLKEPKGATWKSVMLNAKPPLLKIRQQLECDGLAVDTLQRTSASAITLVLFGAVIALGLAKIWVGVNRNRPVGVLVFGEFIAVAVMVSLLATIPRLTRRGRALVDRLKQEHRSEQLAGSAVVRTAAGTVSAEPLPFFGSHMLWSTALLGTTLLATSEMSSLHGFFQRQMHSGGGSGTSGCGGDGGSGCGGGGCGGGCGGCGS